MSQQQSVDSDGSRILLVDPSLREEVGHHMMTLVNFASLLGPERCWFAVNHNYTGTALSNQRVKRAFRFSIYDSQRSSKPHQALTWLGRWVETNVSLRTFDKYVQVGKYIGQRVKNSFLQLIAKRLIKLVLVKSRRAEPDLGYRNGENTANPLPPFHDELVGVLKELGWTANDHIFIPTVNTEIAATILTLTVDIPPRDLPFIHLRFLYTSDWFTTRFDYENILFRLCQTGLIESKIFLYSETEIHAEYLSLRSGHQVTAIPTPVNPIHFHGGSDSLKQVTIGYLGEARRDKGFDKLGPLIGRLFASSPEFHGKVRFVIQAGGSQPEKNQLLADFKAFVDIHKDSCRLITDSLSEQHYKRLIAQLDILLLPYDPVAYRLRGSGIVSEAIANSKPFICSSGSSMRTLIRWQNGLEASNIESWVAAIRYGINNLETLNLGATAARDEYESGLKNIPGYFKRPAVSYSAGANKIALVISQWWPGGGSELVFNSQLWMLNQLGFRVVHLYQHTDLARKEQVSGLSHWFNSLSNRGSHPRSRSLWSDMTFYRPAATDLWDRVTHRASPFRYLDVDMRLRCQHPTPTIIDRLLKSDQLSFVLVNHVQTSQFARRLVSSTTVPMILETHDIQSHQYALRRGFPLSTELHEEFSEISMYDRAVFLSIAEMTEYAHARPLSKNARLIYPTVNPDLERTSSTCRMATESADDLIRRSKPEFPLTKPARRLDLLIVGTWHEANLLALRKFLPRFINSPRLTEYTLYVAGDLGHIIKSGDFGTPDNVVALGRVDDLAPLYAGARTVVVPYTSGAGIPTKFLDAAVRRKPVLVEAPALRALPKSELAGCDFYTFSPDEFFDKIESSLTDELFSQKIAHQSYSLFQRRFAKEQYLCKWRDLLTELDCVPSEVVDAPCSGMAVDA